MQDRYVADIGDFGKFGLLRALCSPDDSDRRLKLGVVWYLVPNEGGNNDGSYTSYLDYTSAYAQQLVDCDPVLYAQLGDLFHRNLRSVASIKDAGILPADTIFYDASLDFSHAIKPMERKPSAKNG